MDYDGMFEAALERLREDGNYRVFADLQRRRGAFPKAVNRREGRTREVTVWCSNDYLGMGPAPGGAGGDA